MTRHRRDVGTVVVAVLLVGVSLALYVSVRASLALEYRTAEVEAWRARAMAAEATVRMLEDPHQHPRAAPVRSFSKKKEASAGVPAMYGEPRIVGLETCSAFRGAVKPHSRRWAPAGMFNCGTNTLLKLLRANCAFEGKGRHALWQAPWGKHNPVAWRGEHWAPQFRPPKWQPAVETIFPVMVVKDPLTWMKSMCRNPYEAHFKHTSRHRSQETCPSPVAETETTVRFQPTRPGHYESLAHLWGEWNAAYLNVSFPRLIVRFEDLLFDSERTVKLACECVGGTARAPFRQAEEATKDESAGHRGPVNDRDKALRLYADETERYAHYTANDLVFVRNALGPSGLLDLFHYGFDVELAPRSNRRRRRRRRLAEYNFFDSNNVTVTI